MPLNLRLAVEHARHTREKAAGLNPSDLRQIVVAHTGHSSQLFPVTTGRNASFVQQVREGLQGP
jgi:hypothetical protein